MAIDIPFGAVDGITAYSYDTNVSFGKLFTGGAAIYLFVQNKIDRESISYTKFGDCNRWIVVGLKPDGATLGSGEGYYPLEQFSASWQEEPNIIWDTNPNLDGGAPPEIEAGTEPKDLAPALCAECIRILGLDANFQITVKGPDTIKDTNFDVGAFMSNFDLTEKPDDPVWNINWRLTRSKTDWQTVTRTGTGYVVGGAMTTNKGFYALYSKADPQPDNLCPEGPCPAHYAVSFSISARGDTVETQTRTVIRCDGSV